MDTFMCRECNENCHGKAEDFTVCSACRVGYEAEIERLREALAKSCEEGRDEMYDCGYNRLLAALEEIDEYHNAGGTQVITCARIARQTLRNV